MLTAYNEKWLLTGIVLLNKSSVKYSHVTDSVMIKNLHRGQCWQVYCNLNDLHLD